MQHNKTSDMPPPESHRPQPPRSAPSFMLQNARQCADERWAAFARSSAVAGLWMIELLLARALVHWQGDSMIFVLATAIGLVLGFSTSLRACWDCFEALCLEQSIRKNG